MKASLANYSDIRLTLFFACLFATTKNKSINHKMRMKCSIACSNKSMAASKPAAIATPNAPHCIFA